MPSRAWIAAGLLMVVALAPVVSSARDTHRTGVSPGPAGLWQAASETEAEAGGGAEDPEVPIWKKQRHKPVGVQARFFAE